MIHATTSTFGRAANAGHTTRRLKLTTTSFWMLFAVEALLVAAVLAAVIRVLPTTTPVSASADVEAVRVAVLDRVNGSTLDPVIEAAPGLVGPASNVRGLALHGTTYYYYFEGLQNVDPLSRNLVSADRTHIVLRDTGGPNPLVIYTIP